MSRTVETVQQYRALPLEEVSCYLCGSTEGRILVDDPPFKVRECSGCGLGYTSPRVRADRIHEIYSDAYFQSERAEQFGYAGYERDMAAYLKTFALKARVIARHLRGRRVLEVGSAAGAFLKVMQDRGCDVTGVEVSPDIVRRAKERFGIQNIHVGRLSDVELPDQAFDLVALFDVVEHLPNPVHELSRCRELLAPGGVLVLQTQDLNSRTRRVLGSRWPHFKQLEHIYHFAPKTIRELLDRAGFRVIDITRRLAGKYVSFHDIADRAHRVLRIPQFLCRPMRLLGNRYLYLNPFDEMLVFATPKASPTAT